MHTNIENAYPTSTHSQIYKLKKEQQQNNKSTFMNDDDI